MKPTYSTQDWSGLSAPWLLGNQYRKPQEFADHLLPLWCKHRLFQKWILWLMWKEGRFFMAVPSKMEPCQAPPKGMHHVLTHAGRPACVDTASQAHKTPRTGNSTLNQGNTLFTLAPNCEPLFCYVFCAKLQNYPKRRARHSTSILTKDSLHGVWTSLVISALHEDPSTTEIEKRENTSAIWTAHLCSVTQENAPQKTATFIIPSLT